jgi:hypothetical protein
MQIERSPKARSSQGSCDTPHRPHFAVEISPRKKPRTDDVLEDGVE